MPGPTLKKVWNHAKGVWEEISTAAKNSRKDYETYMGDALPKNRRKKGKYAK